MIYYYFFSEDDLARRATFPENKDIRAIAAHLATKVMLQALDEGIKVSFLNSTRSLNAKWVFLSVYD